MQFDYRFKRTFNMKCCVKQGLIVSALCLSFWAISGMTEIRAQNLAVKTNLLYDATATINIGAEIPWMSRETTMHGTGRTTGSGDIF